MIEARLEDVNDLVFRETYTREFIPQCCFAGENFILTFGIRRK